MKTFPAGFAAEKNRATGAKPVWILRFSVGGEDYFLSDLAFALPGWQGGVTTLPWIASWGTVQEGIAGELGEIRISDLLVDCLIDPDASPHMADLAIADDFERSPVSLYLWFRGLDPATDPPQEMARFYVRDPVELPDEITVRVGLEDEAIRLQQSLGTTVNRVDYPGADPDDVGKLIPIVFGSVRRLPCPAVDAGIMTSLPTAINAGTTSIPVTDATGLTPGMQLMIDDELISVVNVAGDVLTAVRGVGLSVATIHSRGAVVWQLKAAFAYLVADHAVDSIPKVYGQIGEIVIDITIIASRYLGSGAIATVAAGAIGGQHPDYPGKACITLPSYITEAQAVALGANLTGDPARTGNYTLTGIVSRIGNIADYAISNPQHAHNTEQTREQVANNTPVTGNYIGPTYPAISGIIEQTNTYIFTLTGNDYRQKVTIGGVHQAQFDGYVGGQCVWTGTTSGSSVPTILVEYGNATLNSATRNALYLSPTASTAQSSSKTPANNGTLDVNDGRGLADTLGVNRGNLNVEITGNSTANTLVGDRVLVDVVRNLYTPPAVCAELLGRCGIATLDTIGDFPAGYRFDFALVDSRRAIDVLDSLAFQCRAYFRLRLGAGRLIVRPDALVPVKSIPAIRLNKGRLSLSRRKAAMSEVINTIDLLYDRDWSAGGSDKHSYRAALKDVNGQSVTDYGVKERPELFRFDAIRDPAMAASLLAFYLAEYSRRYWVHEFEVFLHHSELEFADAVTLDFLDFIAAEVQSAGISPGDLGRADVIRLNCRSRLPGAVHAPRYVLDADDTYVLTDSTGTFALTTRS